MSDLITEATVTFDDGSWSFNFGDCIYGAKKTFGTGYPMPPFPQSATISWLDANERHHQTTVKIKDAVGPATPDGNLIFEIKGVNDVAVTFYP